MSELMIDRAFAAEFLLADLSLGDAMAFVRDARRSLARSDLLQNVDLAPDGTVKAELPVAAGPLGTRSLPFQSRIVPSSEGATLLGRDLADLAAWARVEGQARVRPEGAAVRYRYDLQVQVHLRLPPAGGRFGERALTRMIRITADRMLHRVEERFPRALRAAVKDAAAVPA